MHKRVRLGWSEPRLVLGPWRDLLTHRPSLSVQQDEGLQLLWDASPVVEPVLDDGPGGQALQSGVVYGLDDVPGQLLRVQEVTGGLLERVCAVKMTPAGNQQVHYVWVTVGGGHVKRTGGRERRDLTSGRSDKSTQSGRAATPVVVVVAAVGVGAAFQQNGGDREGGELADGVAPHAGGVAVHGQVQRAVSIFTARLELQKSEKTAQHH